MYFYLCVIGGPWWCLNNLMWYLFQSALTVETTNKSLVVSINIALICKINVQTYNFLSVMRLTACVWICEWRLKKKMLYLNYHIALWHAVQGAVSLLSARTTLLDHVQVEHIEGRLTSLNTKLAQITDKKDALESTEKQNKVINTFTFSCTLHLENCSIMLCKNQIIFWYLRVRFLKYVVQHKLFVWTFTKTYV